MTTLPPAKLRILVVEDDPGTLAATLDLLELLGHWATGVKSAELAMSRFLEGAFDVLLIDLNLPGLSGVELADNLRQREPLPVIFVTGGGPAARDLPADALWLRKPYTVEELEAALARCATTKPLDEV